MVTFAGTDATDLSHASAMTNAVAGAGEVIVSDVGLPLPPIISVNVAAVWEATAVVLMINVAVALPAATVIDGRRVADPRLLDK